MRVQDSEDGVRLELFYDGEIADVGTDLQGFINAIKASVSKGLQDRKMQRFRHMLERKNAGHTDEWEKFMKETNEKGDVEVKLDIDLNGATSAEDTNSPFREAGCVLSFVAVSVTASPGTADLLGEICFPE
ncbi:hypothetical protein FOZ63_013411 [Perkinsus olseni]|uniref:Uncharacterized protein n=1 Tax=Perkinsus olseni TaxID=32597 RepID=A0A7J6TW33_PEROL|nr:hypothetical protein FOZ63_013411 [Perkinsus olseni]KAF4752994.1 hypothetical protein FOZ62_012129 [Perkinsus olseni]